jgi:hypothetical protein
MTVQEQTAVDTILKSGIFDSAYYALQAGQNFTSIEKAIEHYLESGCANNFNPHPLFDTKFYLETYTDVASAGVNPLMHYLLQGGFENRKPCLEFDSTFYLSSNPDVKALKSNPLSHFILLGAREGRKPNAIFDSAFYLKQYADVKESGLNPLVHYITEGQKEGRRPNARPLYPRELYLQMRQLEPLLPQYEALQSIRESKESFISNAGLVYDKLKTEINGRFSHLYVCANNEQSLKTAANLVEALTKAGGRNKALIVITGRPQSETEKILEQLKSSASVVSLQNFGKKLESEEESQIICRLAIQAQPHVIHAIDSLPCLNLFRRMPKPLSLNSKLFASAHAFTIDDDGILSGPNLSLSPCADALTAIFVKGDEVFAQLINQIGFDQIFAQKMVVLNEENSVSMAEKLQQHSYFCY